MLPKVHLVKAMVFPVVMYGCENWNIKKAECQRIDAFELFKKTLESHLDSKKIKQANPKRNQSWIFIGRTDAEAETPIHWPPDVKSWLIGKDPDAGKDWKQEEKGTTEDVKVEWHHWLNGNEFEQAPGIGDGQRSLACCNPRGCKESGTTMWLNWTKFIWASKLLWMVTAVMKVKDTCSWKKSYGKRKLHIISRDITLPTNICILKAMIFPIFMYRCESWSIRKAEHLRIDAFEL